MAARASLAACGLVAVSSIALAQPNIDLQAIASGLPLPVAATHAGDGSGRLFITLQNGQVVIYDGTQVLPIRFLTLTSLVSCCGERGLLSVAFHPDYSTNGLFFVSYTDTAGDSVIARYSVSSTDANVADPDSALTILTADQPFGNHNGGQLQFGPDGYLYISLGDGGSSGDPQNRAQSLGTVLGKILRIDVDSGTPYAIPVDNPFVGVLGAREEIWAYGLRNPWRFSFDRSTGDLFIGDVGQNIWEEVNFQSASSPGGENYGWRRMEGNHCFNPATNCNDGTLTIPILEYQHTLGCSVTGGYRYRGSAIFALQGMYLFGDYCTGRIWSALPVGGGVWNAGQLLDTSLLISSFGEDAEGELFVADHSAPNGTLYRIIEATSPSGPEVSVSPGSLAFGAQLVEGGPTASLNVVIRNVGTAALAIGGVNLGGTSPSEFRLTADTGQIVLPPGQQRIVTLDFDPQENGGHFGSLTIFTNDADEDVTEVTLTGLGAEPTFVNLPGCLIDTNETFVAADALRAVICSIVAPGEVTFLAGRLIALDNGFFVGSGAMLTAAIDPALRHFVLP
ncbi:MAG TPA: PQQ-dependent sugar dehydrogenase [Vicinamibacteria bacterium]|nr:PQQ-dependent sugar dehydrogenase [Vicinamibacteria bacterium]